MTIATIRVTSSPMYDINSLCEANNIPYVHLQTMDTGRYGTPEGYVDTVLAPNRLVIADSLAVLLHYFDSMLEHKASWAVIVRGSELEASEHRLAYAPAAYRSWLMHALMEGSTPVKAYPEKVMSANKNNSYLSQVLTDLYRIKPKEDRPFDRVFGYLAGKLGFPKNLPAYLERSLKLAVPIRNAILGLSRDYGIENIRAAAKSNRMDVFDINYTLAKTGLLPNRRDAVRCEDIKREKDKITADKPRRGKT